MTNERVTYVDNETLRFVDDTGGVLDLAKMADALTAVAVAFGPRLPSRDEWGGGMFRDPVDAARRGVATHNDRLALQAMLALGVL